MMIWKKKPKLLKISKYVWCNKRILVLEKEFPKTIDERLRKLWAT